MNYGAALPAGSYRGSLGRYHYGLRPGARVSRSGRTLRDALKRRALAGAFGGFGFSFRPTWI